ncbi:MAG: carbamoyltransferase HypF [Terracidiphilus sp.]
MAEKTSPSESMQKTAQRCRVRVRGVVQGVGFRPFVYRLATEEALAGFIGNDTDGVTIEIEGDAARMQRFLARLRSEMPPMARIDHVDVCDVAVTGAIGFQIVASEVRGRVSTGIPADAATCEDCLRELLDPRDRRFRYPFLNCTNCGPRFTITRRIPYDRKQTSMAAFTMCAACQAEYDDPANRRFHAQPNACWECGPKVWLEAPDGSRCEARDPIASVIERLVAGDVVAVKGLGGFHLSVDATKESAVQKLRTRKRRYGKPLAVMVRDLAGARELCALSRAEEALLQSAARPIVLARALRGNGIAQSVAPGIPWLGIFLPYTPLQHLLFADGRLRALVMTSANLSDEPIAIDNEEARERLGAIADVFVMHDRAILQRCDDSVMAVVEAAPQVIRRARGYVPLGVPLPLPAEPLLAVGGHLKNVFALAQGTMVYQSQHLGDLEDLTALNFFKESLEHLAHTFEVEPQYVVHDLHPGYLSTRWAREWAAERNLPLQGVQHHHAHIAGCMAESGLQETVIGLALDGTGYGTDGRIWGGEVLICELDGFERFAHLDYVPMPGGDVAVKEPWRMAAGALHAAGYALEDPAVRGMLDATEHQAKLLVTMMERGVNAPQTSSLGRLFDAVAAVVLHRRRVEYEAQAAMELEGCAVDAPDEQGYPMECIEGDWTQRESMRICARPLWEALLEDLRRGESVERMSARFHAGVAAAFVQAAIRASAATGVVKVALSGGCMHNRRLVRLLHEGLTHAGLETVEHRQVSPGDGGLSYGQAAVAAARLRARV